MNEAGFRASLRSTHHLFADLGLLSLSRSYSSLEPSEEFRRAALRTGKYAEIFRLGLRNRDYNLLLVDFSFFQFYFARTQQAFQVRYAYYPNPYEVVTFSEYCEALGVPETEGDPYELYLESLTEAEEINRVPVIRFDLSFGQYRELAHPAAHFHFGTHPDNRWPVERVLTPRAFALLICKQFYGEAWHEMGVDPASDPDDLNVFDKRLCDEKAACEVLRAEYFSDIERRQPFFS